LSSADPTPAAATRRFARGAGLLAVGIAATGIVTFAYFSVASHTLTKDEYARIARLWSILLIVVAVVHRPIEQLISSTLARHRVAGTHAGGGVRGALILQTGLGCAWLAAGILLRGELRDGPFDGSATLTWILIASVPAYAVGYIARGWLAGSGRFLAYGALTLLEASTRLCFALVVAIGLAEGQDAVALGIPVAGVASLLLVAGVALRRRPPPSQTAAPASDLGRGAGFALGALIVLVCEQGLLGIPVLAADSLSNDTALSGLVFNLLVVMRAPLHLFQSVQVSLLPHLAGLRAGGDHTAFSHALRTVVASSVAVGIGASVVLLGAGPPLMGLVFGDGADYPRSALTLMGAAIALHLTASALTQAALADHAANRAAVAWVLGVAAMGAVLAVDPGWNHLLLAAVSYVAATLVICAALVIDAQRRSLVGERLEHVEA
jgi:O-antigen/teichoic acid export membrane protein